MAPRIATMHNAPRQARRIRRPEHRFQVRTRPWQIQPMLIAPVLPGETMRNLLLQSRVVSDPVRHPLVGWWKEYYFFYVKHRDMHIRDDTTRMVLQPGYDLREDHNVASAIHAHYKYANTVDWVGLCMQRVVEEYFRFEAEQFDDFMIGGLPAAQIGVQNWMDSIMDADEYTGILDTDETRAPVSDDPADHVKASHIEDAMRNYEWLRMNNLTDMTYDQFIGTYGVRIRTEELHRPELIRYIREWTYPTNHVDPADGTPSSALSWSIAERADKDRFFPEPGFIFGCTITRPKVFFGNQHGAAVGLLTDAVSWLPAILHDRPEVSYVRRTPGSNSPVAMNGGADIMIDLRDIYLYGDQFRNFEPSADQKDPDSRDAIVDLPEAADVQRRYATEEDAYNLFADPWTSEGATPPAKHLIREDGIVTMMIAGRQVDATAAMP